MIGVWGIRSKKSPASVRIRPSDNCSAGIEAITSGRSKMQPNCSGKPGEDVTQGFAGATADITDQSRGRKIVAGSNGSMTIIGKCAIIVS